MFWKRWKIFIRPVSRLNYVFLSQNWSRHVRDYLLVLNKSDCGPLNEPYTLREANEFLERSVKAVKLHAYLGTTVDFSLGRIQPIWAFYPMPYLLIHVPTIQDTQITVADDYLEYLRIVSIMLDKGVMVTEEIPEHMAEYLNYKYSHYL